VDDNTGDTVIVVKDRQTDEVVRQIPSEDVLQLAQKLLELQEELEGSKGNLLEVRV
jgi:flagellar protein FlaG